MHRIINIYLLQIAIHTQHMMGVVINKKTSILLVAYGEGSRPVI